MTTPPITPLTTALELAAVIDDVPALVALVDPDLTIRFANWAHQAWFGKAPHEVVGHSAQLLVGDVAFAEAQPFYAAALRGEPQTFERVITHVDGTRRDTVVNYEPYYVDGQLRGIVSVVTDVTGRTRTEFARRELAERAATIGDRERNALAKQRAAMERLNLMAADLAVVADRYPEHGAAVRDAARAMDDAARQLAALSSRGAGAPLGAEAAIRDRVDAATDALGNRPSLTVMGDPNLLEGEAGALAAQALEIMLRNIWGERADVTVSLEGAHLVVVVADEDDVEILHAEPGGDLDQLRQLATSHGGDCSWYINSQDGTTVEWRIPLPRSGASASDETGIQGSATSSATSSATPIGRGLRPPVGYRTAAGLVLSDDEMRALLEHVPIGLAVWDRGFRNCYSNSHASQWFGMPDPDELLGRHYSEFVDPATFERARPLANAALAGSHAVVERPFVRVGRPRYIRAEFLPRQVGDEIVGMNVIVTDIGEQVRAESAMRAEHARIDALRRRYAAEEEVHHLAIQEVFGAALRLDALRPTQAEALADLDNALAPLDIAIADLRESVVDVPISA